MYYLLSSIKACSLSQVYKCSMAIVKYTFMSKILLIHNSHTLYTSLKPPTNERPLFYWYTDRFFHFEGTTKYLYFFVIDPKKDNIALRARNDNLDFDSLHKAFLYYMDFCDGKFPEYKYAEPGIAMSFSELTPSLVLLARSYGSGKEEWLQSKYEILQPHKPFTKRVISLFEKPYAEINGGMPIKFTEIPELVELIPDIHDLLPIKPIEPDVNGIYHYGSWLPMKTDKRSTWL